MALYHGWNQQETREVGNAIRQISSLEQDYHVTSPQPIVTPIDHGRTPLRYLPPQTTLHSRDVERKPLSVVSSQELSEAPVPHSKKRASAQGKARAVSLAEVWGYKDEGDLADQNQSEDFETSFPKRRKWAPAKPPKASSTLAGKALNIQWAPEENGAEPRNDNTLPNLGTVSKKRAALPKPQVTKYKSGLFQSPAITKPTSREVDIEANELYPSILSTHTGWTTTEDALKSNSSINSKTTLDKLATFRYKSSSTNKGPENSAKVASSSQLETDSQLLGGEITLTRSFPPQLESSARGEGGLSSHIIANDSGCQAVLAGDQMQTGVRERDVLRFDNGNDPVIATDDFFKDALWGAQCYGNLSSVQPNQMEHQLPAASTADLSQFLFGAQMQLQAQQPFTGPLTQPAVHDRGVVKSSFDYGGPASSEKMALNTLVNSVSAPQDRNACTSGRLENLEVIDYDYELEASGVADELVDPVGLSPFPQEDANEAPLDHVSSTVGDESSTLSEVMARQKTGHYRHLKASADARVERLDFEELESAPSDVAKCVDSDEFDEDGLDDSDLLSIALDPVVRSLDAQLSSTSREQGVQKGKSLGSVSLPQVPDLPACEAKGCTLDTVASGAVSSEHRHFDEDEDFPMDEAEEKDLMKLLYPMHGVVETYQPPASVQRHTSVSSRSEERYDDTLQFSPPKTPGIPATKGRMAKSWADKYSTSQSPNDRTEHDPFPCAEEEDWSYIRLSDRGESTVQMPRSNAIPGTHTSKLLCSRQVMSSPVSNKVQKHTTHLGSQASGTELTSTTIRAILDDSHEYEPMNPIVRPNFPVPMLDRSPVVGLSSQTFLRVCFRIGEMFKEGGRCNTLNDDAIIELFARVTFSSREPGTTRQTFQFMDLWHDRPPFPNGILMNYRTTGLAETESQEFLGAKGLMARCFGRWKRDKKNATGWLLHILTIRRTDWEEIRWTKRIVSAGSEKSESKL